MDRASDSDAGFPVSYPASGKVIFQSGMNQGLVSPVLIIVVILNLRLSIFDNKKLHYREIIISF